jgi:asparagine N-glycosylation enzyme membrane subunit Stt3
VPAVIASVALVPLTWALGNYIGPRPAGFIAALPIAVAPPVLARTLASSGGGFSLAFALQWGALLCIVRALTAVARLSPVRASGNGLTARLPATGAAVLPAEGMDESPRHKPAPQCVALFSLLAGLAMWIWQPALVALPLLLVVLLLRRPSLRRPSIQLEHWRAST